MAQFQYTDGEQTYRVHDDPALEPLAWIMQRPPAERCPLLMKHSREAFLRRKPTKVSPYLFAVARLEMGRWIVDCPLRDPQRDGDPCNNAQFVMWSDPRFWCDACFNANVGGEWLQVVRPEPELRSEIESELRTRPKAADRNWVPGEDLDYLRAESRVVHEYHREGWSHERTLATVATLRRAMAEGVPAERALTEAVRFGRALAEEAG